MKARASSVLGAILLITLSLLLAGSVAASPSAYPALAGNPLAVRINEVMPRPGPGQHD